MKQNHKINKKELSLHIIIYIFLGFICAVISIWLNELFDLPSVIFNKKPTPINFTESIIESAIIIILGTLVIFHLINFLKKIRHLEGFLPVCAFCKKIRVENKWIPIEEYIEKNSSASFTHSFCPECAKKHYKKLLKKS